MLSSQIVHVNYLHVINSQITKEIGGELVSYEYDSNGRLRRGTNRVGTVELVYDGNGRPSRILYPNGRGLNYGYNGKDQRTYIADNLGYNITYTYDGHNRLSEIRNALNTELIVRYVYLETGEVSGKILGNGANTTYIYDGPNRQLSAVRNFLPNGEESSYFIYGYDKRGRITTLRTESGIWTYSYDPASQLVKWVNPENDTVEYTYDSRGNRLVQTRNGQEEGYSVNSVNQHLMYNGTESFTFDANGYLKQKATQGRTERFVFNVEGKLTEAENPNKRSVIDGGICAY